MSEKVLKLAGRRPILLGLIIMATITIGLLFSGWLAPTPGRAQNGGGNPSSANENTNCPNYTYTTNTTCPSITNGMSLAPMIFCVKFGDPLPDPSWASNPPGATPGSVVITTTETCSNVVTSATNAITYGFGWFYGGPGKPTAPTPGTYTSPSIWGHVVSSDTNDCPSPADVNLGQVTWHVINTTPTSSSATIDFGPFIHGMEAVLKEIPAGCSFSDPGGLTFTKTIKTTPICCSDGSVAAEIERSGSLSASVGGSCSTPSYPLPITLGICQVQLTASGTISLDASLKSTSTSCPNDPPGYYCLVPSVTFTATGSISLSVFSQSLFFVTGAISGGGAWSGSWCYSNLDDSPDPHSKPFKLCYNDITLTGSYTLLNGLTKAISITLVNGSCP
jgi:hypothetical protein